MSKLHTRLVQMAAVMALFARTASAINCYQCSGTDPENPFICNEFIDSVEEEDMELKSCDNVYGANFCIKHTGRFEAQCIKCYQCDSIDNIDCTDVLINEDDSSLKPENCDSVFEAQYCVKNTGLRGGIGTRRFCSGLDLGNYCNYVQNKGDQLEYRSCIFTCGTDGCNGSSALNPTSAMVSSLSIATLYYIARQSTT